MEFEPIEVIFMLVWGFFLFKAFVGGRKKSAELPEESSDTPNVEEAPETAPEGGYDYERLRRKIRKSWGEEPKEEPKEEPIVFDDKKEEQKEKNKSLYSFPVSATIGEKLKPSLKTNTKISDFPKEKPRIFAAEKPKEMVTCAGSFAAKKWTAADAETWLAYDAVFGTPRAKSPWRPYGQK